MAMVPSLPQIASRFVRQLYCILNGQFAGIISWNELGTAFTVFDIDMLVDRVLPLYFRGRLDAFRQQLREHGFQRIMSSSLATAETYRHAHFLRGNPNALSCIVRTPLPRKRTRRKKPAAVKVEVKMESVDSVGVPCGDPIKSEDVELNYAGNSANPLFSDDDRFDILQWLELPAVDDVPHTSNGRASGGSEIELLLVDGDGGDLELADALTNEQIDVFMRVLATPLRDDSEQPRATSSPSPAASCLRSPLWDGGNQFSEDTLRSMLEMFSSVPT